MSMYVVGKKERKKGREKEKEVPIFSLSVSP